MSQSPTSKITVIIGMVATQFIVETRTLLIKIVNYTRQQVNPRFHAEQTVWMVFLAIGSQRKEG